MIGPTITLEDNCSLRVCREGLRGFCTYQLTTKPQGFGIDHFNFMQVDYLGKESINSMMLPMSTLYEYTLVGKPNMFNEFNYVYKFKLKRTRDIIRLADVTRNISWFIRYV